MARGIVDIQSEKLAGAGICQGPIYLPNRRRQPIRCLPFRVPTICRDCSGVLQNPRSLQR